MKPGDSYRINDLELASRLSYFLWDDAPDRALVQAATSGTLRTPAGLERQVRRMLADRRSETLVTRFASEWLRLQDLDQIVQRIGRPRILQTSKNLAEILHPTPLSN